jgi:F-type H+-transporting ATPase subunit delta
LFDVALKESDPELADRDLAAFAELVAGHAELDRVLRHPAVPASSKRAIVETLAARGKLSSPVTKLLLLLADRDRLLLVPLVREEYHARLLDYLQVVRAEVTTAVPLGEPAQKAVEEGLRALTGQTVSMTARVDPEILGGVVTQIGSTVYDGSVRRQLERMRERLTGSGVRQTA